MKIVYPIHTKSECIYVLSSIGTLSYVINTYYDQYDRPVSWRCRPDRGRYSVYDCRYSSWSSCYGRQYIGSYIYCISANERTIYRTVASCVAQLSRDTTPFCNTSANPLFWKQYPEPPRSYWLNIRLISLVQTHDVFRPTAHLE